MQRLRRDVAMADLLRPATLAPALAGCDAVVHLSHGERGPEATQNLLSAMSDAGIRRLVHISTMSVHGPDPDASSEREETALIGRYGNDYCDSKAEQEELVWAAHRAGRLDLVVLRPTVVYGPGSAFVELVAEEARAGNVLLIDQGVGRCNAVFVDDVCHAIDCALSNNDRGQAYFVNGDGSISWREFIEAFARLDGRSPRFTNIDAAAARSYWQELQATPRPGALTRLWRKVTSRLGASTPRHPFPPLGRIQRETIRVTFSNAKARSELGWAPTITFAEGVGLTAAAMRSSTKPL